MNKKEYKHLLRVMIVAAHAAGNDVLPKDISHKKLKKSTDYFMNKIEKFQFSQIQQNDIRPQPETGMTKEQEREISEQIGNILKHAGQGNGVEEIYVSIDFSGGKIKSEEC